ncbi:hypothetical protein DRO19_01630 [Candidatus Bathyarchaeota archaeon]|nr:MAG: hypothetical protein DRO19_01630 [Candidatus Bathyarchaeota archaeon]
MKMDENIEYIGEGIDRLVTLDVRARGVIYNLYDAARKLVDSPLTLTAARRIVETVKDGDTVIITTGFRVLPQKVQETDGPLGAAALAKSLIKAFNANPIVVIEEPSREIMASTLRALGINPVMNEADFKKGENSVLILDFPFELENAIEAAKRIVEKYKPSLVFATEKAGRNVKGEYHTMRGVNISSFHAKIEPLIEEARSRGILTIGVGDGGNEVGMGNIREAIEKFVPYAKECQCPCKGGIAAESKVDLLVVASISNWGVYGIEACIAALTENMEALHTAEEEEEMLRNSIKAGAVDGVTSKPELSVDSAPLKVHTSIIRILEGLIGK